MTSTNSVYEALSCFFPYGQNCEIYAFDEVKRKIVPLAAKLNCQIATFEELSLKQVNSGSLAIVIAPDLPEDSSPESLVKFSLESLTYANALSRLRKAEVSLIMTTCHALATARPEEFLPLSAAEQRQACEILEQLEKGTIFLQASNQIWNLPKGGWEIETTDVLFSQITQAPGGEVFCHFDCDWTGTIAVNVIGQDMIFDEVHLKLHNGVVCNAQKPSGKQFNKELNCFLGKKVSEIGLGLNRNIQHSPTPWVEKRWGCLHLGFGPRVEGDTAPPSVHFDVILPKNAQLLTADSTGGSYGVPIL